MKKMIFIFICSLLFTNSSYAGKMASLDGNPVKAMDLTVLYNWKLDANSAPGHTACLGYSNLPNPPTEGLVRINVDKDSDPVEIYDVNGIDKSNCYNSKIQPGQSRSCLLGFTNNGKNYVCLTWRRTSDAVSSHGTLHLRFMN